MARSHVIGSRAIMTMSLFAVSVLGCAQERSADDDPAPIARTDAGLLEGITMDRLEGGEVALADHHGRAVLIVNTASQCGFVDDFEGLQNLHERYGEQGLTIIGVPSADFGGQEFDNAVAIREFCEQNYGVEFLMLEKSHVTGDDQVELFQRLTDPANDVDELGEIEWNFEKFLLDRQGRLVARFRSRQSPESDEVVNAIERALASS